ncbi:MAG: Gfo/Idh/MocA family protein [Enterococcus sp.]
MKLAIIGSGMIVHEFLSITKDLPEISLAALVGTKRSYEKLEALQNEYQIKDIYTDFSECVAKSDFDTVYVAVPNHLHFTFAKAALLAGKHVICEKPFTLNLAQMLELKELALAKQLILVEAITNQYLANYLQIKDQLPELGELKIMECNYSQYSSRYDAFKEGTILPAFDPTKGGGALMDINIYNIHFVVGLLGKPDSVQYLANVERNIDTSGILILNYPDTKVVCIGAKDSSASIRSTIQGNLGSIIINGSTSEIVSYDKQIGKKATQRYEQQPGLHRMHAEFVEFTRMIAENDLTNTKKQLEHSQIVMEIVDVALRDAGIVLGTAN